MRTMARLVLRCMALSLLLLPPCEAFTLLTQGQGIFSFPSSNTYSATSYTSSSRRWRHQQDHHPKYDGGVLSTTTTTTTRLYMDFLESPFKEDVQTTARNVPAPEALMDNQGQEFSVGAVVRVAQAGLGAFQVPPKARGCFDTDTKQFVAAKGDKSLSLPVGLRGVITKIYDPNAGISANYPVQVKFAPDEYTEEGYSAPTMFLMHFMPHEIECV
jgi:hypothetical protein